MDIREIEIFRAVMQAGSTSKAANLLDISQPAVSQSIKKFESASGLQLFDRVRGRLVPTLEAQALLVEVDLYFSGLENLRHRIKSLKRYGVQRLAVAAYPALGTGFMARSIGAFDPSTRGISMSLQIMSSREVHQRVSVGRADFGLMADELAVGGMESSVFMSEPGVIVMAKDHPLSTRKTISPQDLAHWPFIALNPEDAARERLDGALAQAGIALEPTVETIFSHSICELALCGVGIGMSNPIVAYDYAARGLVIRPFSIEVPFKCLLIFTAGRGLSENARDLLKTMRMQMADDLGRLSGLLRSRAE
jgi:DNA-binding transcriptional LysR family regulator